jgi:hypothetical protein
MRLKSLNLDKRVDTFPDIKGSTIQDFSKNVNRLGTLFDSLLMLENYVIDNILQEIAELISIRSQRLEIEGRWGINAYLEDHFIPQARKINDKIELLKKQWNSKSDASIKFYELEEFIRGLKFLSKSLEEIEKRIPYFTTILSLRKLIDEFAKFRIVKALFTTDVVERMNIILKIGGEVNIENMAKLEEIDQLTIDDL